MKLKVIVSLLFIAAIYKTNAQPSCQSLFSNIVRTADNVITKISNLEQTAADALGPYIISAATGVPPKFTTTPQAKRAISDMADAAIAVQNEILGLIGEVSGDGKGSVGPRYLYIPTIRVSGELLTERTFMVTPSSFHKVTVKIKKLDGKAGANIAVCAKWPDGREYNTKDRQYFVTGDESVGKEQEWVFTNMKDKWLTIHLVQTGVVTNKFDYQLSIEGEYDPGSLYAMNESHKNNNGNANSSGQKNKQTTVPTPPNTIMAPTDPSSIGPKIITTTNKVDSSKTKVKKNN